MRHAQAQGPLQVLESCARRVRALVKTQPGQMSNGPYSAPTFWIRLLGDLDAAMAIFNHPTVTNVILSEVLTTTSENTRLTAQVFSVKKPKPKKFQKDGNKFYL